MTVRPRLTLPGLTLGFLALVFVPGPGQSQAAERRAGARPPNILFVLADQWRAEAFGYAGNPDVKTPNLDRLQRDGVHFVNAVSCVPVCSPTRASLLTGQRPLTHGVFLNDVQLNPEAVTIAKVLRGIGLRHGLSLASGTWTGTAARTSSRANADRDLIIGKCWSARMTITTPPITRTVKKKLYWEGYDAIAQTRDAQQYVHNHAQSQKPFFLVLAWGPPHDPSFTAPGKLPLVV